MEVGMQVYNIYFLSYVVGIIKLWVTVEAPTLLFISGRGSAISSAKNRKSGSIYIWQ